MPPSASSAGGEERPHRADRRLGRAHGLPPEQAWQDAGLPPVTVSVNVSPRQFAEQQWVSRVERALEESGLAAHSLEFEITESMIMDNQEPALARMEQLQAMGVGLAIDDFGTGYSSLGALKSFPIARLKIDKSFVRDLPADVDQRAIVSAIIELGHKMSLKVLAEGVETRPQMEFLRESGCDEVQGYLYARPMAALEFERMAAIAGPCTLPNRCLAALEGVCRYRWTASFVADQVVDP